MNDPPCSILNYFFQTTPVGISTTRQPLSYSTVIGLGQYQSPMYWLTQFYNVASVIDVCYGQYSYNKIDTIINTITGRLITHGSFWNNNTWEICTWFRSRNDVASRMRTHCTTITYTDSKIDSIQTYRPINGQMWTFTKVYNSSKLDTIYIASYAGAYQYDVGSGCLRWQ